MNKSILIFGGGNPELYDDNYYEVGNHPTADYGSGLEWNELKFWEDFKIKIGEKKFRAILFDVGSESWLPTDEKIIDKIVEIIEVLINDKGIILYEVNNLLHGEFPSKIKVKLEEKIGLICTFRYNDKANMYQVIGLLSKTKEIGKTLLKNADNINDKTTKYGEHKPGWFDFNKDVKPVSEKNQIEFIKNRIIVTIEEIEKEIKEISVITNNINTKINENIDMYTKKKDYIINLLE